MGDVYSEDGTRWRCLSAFSFLVTLPDWTVAKRHFCSIAVEGGTAFKKEGQVHELRNGHFLPPVVDSLARVLSEELIIF